MYVRELQIIENDARRLIIESHDLDMQISAFESKTDSQNERDKLRAELLKKICHINSVANTMGKGRDDFTFDILIKAEQLINQSDLPEAVNKLAFDVK